MAFKWSEQYEVGVKTFDLQHKKLFYYVNSLSIAIKANSGREKVYEIIEELVDYTVNHFSDEEKAMKENNYKDFEIHKKEHEKLKQRVVTLYEDYQNNNDPESEEFLEFITRWLRDHIAVTDKKYAPLLREMN